MLSAKTIYSEDLVCVNLKLVLVLDISKVGSKPDAFTIKYESGSITVELGNCHLVTLSILSLKC